MSQDSNVSSLAPNFIENIDGEDPMPPPPAPGNPLPGPSGRRHRPGRGPLGTGAIGVNMSERQATNLSMALNSAFTLLCISEPRRVGPMPESCGPKLHEKLKEVLASPQFNL